MTRFLKINEKKIQGATVNHNGHSSFDSSGAAGFDHISVFNETNNSPLSTNGSNTCHGRLDPSGAG